MSNNLSDYCKSNVKEAATVLNSKSLNLNN